MWKPRIGMKVIDAVLGLGEIIGISPFGVRIKLEKYNNTVIEKRPEEVQLQITDNEKLIHDQTENMISATIEESTFRSLKAIDALRFGLVPEDFIEDLTIGFAELEEWVLGRLPNHNQNSPQVSEVIGPFGSGKSHTMSLIRYVARREGYATAKVEVDGQNISLSDPEKLLCSLWSSIDAPDFESPTPLLDFYVRSINRQNPAPHIAPKGIDRIHKNYNTIKLVNDRGHLDKHGDALDAIISSSDEYTAQDVKKMIYSENNINGLEVDVRRMIGLKVDERPYDFIESLVGHAHMANLAGFKGLVVTIDEFEVERFYHRNFDRVVALLEVLGQYLEGKLDHAKYPISIFFATVGQEGNRGDDYIDSLIDSIDGDCFEIPELSPGDRFNLAKRIHTLYDRAYQIAASFDPAIANEAENEVSGQGGGDSGIMRSYIKKYICALDGAHGPSGGH